MVTLLKPRSNPGSIWTPRTDRSEVLYAPLWHPSLGVAAGGSFKSLDRTGHICTVTGATWGRQGRTFNGASDGIVVPDHAALNFTGAFTIKAWVKLTDVNVSSIICMRGTNQNYRLSYDTGAGWAIYFWSGGAIRYKQAGIALNNTWYHVVASWNLTYLTLFVNGEDLGSPVEALGAVDTNAVALNIGKRGDESGNWLGGTLGELSIISHALEGFLKIRDYQETKWKYGL